MARDPNWLAHRYDPTHDSIHFRHVPREAHRTIAFLTDELLPAPADPVVVPRDQARTLAGEPAPVHFILHSGYCCSTLMASALDIEGVSMGLKEPVILNDLAGWRRRGAEPRSAVRVLDDALELLARPFRPGEAVVIKPSNVITGLAPEMLAMRPNARALLLHAPLPVYLGSIANKGLWGRLWVRELLLGLLKDGLVDLGFSDEQYFMLTDLQAAAVGWIAQQVRFAGLIERFGPERVRSLDSETLTTQPRTVMQGIAGLFGLQLDQARLGAVVEGPAFTRHSKSGRRFGMRDRAKEQRIAASAHRDEIEKVEQWARAVAANAGAMLELKTPLVRPA